MQKIKPGADLAALMKAINQCDGDVYFNTRTDHIDLKSVLSQYVFFSIIGSADPNASGVECTHDEDYARIAAFLA